ncbi:uncharacterized protein PITG_07420 [Phytophthora infestans T30-4]|uniref:Uncharacterized protein n=1 Tax=Phytophthora infestans (strain T30-4) TaxID=403677 RepID=D0N8D1_PHYIT|nr:uncharacterized protein PITG_07420 [Phytophthora infestans T30-4]EEY53816.1 hypothetical protein PITG_07420 [Phytophthora infestans T30-4]|eukprot:XP_002904447.1 hypothetical protein PITG_07420 [Phytophthora infestans T30-4]
MKNKLRRPKPNEWFSIKCLQRLLGPFTVASDTLGRQNYHTMPLDLPLISGIRSHLESKNLFAALEAEAGEECFVHEMHEWRLQTHAVIRLLKDQSNLQKPAEIWQGLQ